MFRELEINVFNECSIPISSRSSYSSFSWRVRRKSYFECFFSAQKYNCGIVCSMKKLVDVEAIKIPPKDMTFPFAPKIYAVYDKEKDLQDVGLTR
jgi:hypothetical protein